MIREIRKLVRKLGFDVRRFDDGMMGHDPLRDMARFLKKDRPMVFDIGANVGQSIDYFRAQFPACEIHSFEPSPATFETLKQKASAIEDVHLWDCGMGSTPGQMTLLENERSQMTSFLPLSESGWGKVTNEVQVEVKTVDQFCAEQNIERVDVLKSDAQGFDFEVLKGAEGMMRASKIGLVYFEIIFAEENLYKNPPSFTKTYDFLMERGFRLVSLYDFFHQSQGLASWTDGLFVHESCIEASS